ncbi:MAG: YIP1 family protein [Bacteroidales bacterium]|nr:YIP1 family protein [Bacteroidales bacterium]
MIDLRMLRNRVRYIIVHPDKAWKTIKKEDRSVKTVQSSFLIPVLTLISLSAFAGSLIYNPLGLSVLFPVIKALKQFICFYLTILLSSWVLNEVSIAFMQKKSYSFNFKLVTYSLSPLYVTVLVTRFLPDLGLINILALYGAYIMFTGLGTLENISSRSLIRYFIVALLSVVTFYLTISWISSSVLEGVYFAIAGNR